jgi:uncharacterized membrane protein YiaA
MKELSTKTALVLYGLGLLVAVIGLFNVTVLKVAGILIMVLAIGLTVFGSD